MSNGLSCRYCQAHLDGYLDGQLTPKARRRVAEHLARCESCYVEYVRRRDLHGELQRTLPLVGQRQMPDFARTWQAIRVELPHPTYERRRDQARYGLAAVMVMLVLLLPFTMGHRDLPLLPPRPAPDSTVKSGTPAHLEPIAIATVAVTQRHDDHTATELPTVPEPDAPRGIDGNND